MSLPVAVCSGLANSLSEKLTLGELITKYGIPLPLPQAIYMWASQLFRIHKGKIHGQLTTISTTQQQSMGELKTLWF